MTVEESWTKQFMPAIEYPPQILSDSLASRGDFRHGADGQLKEQGPELFLPILSGTIRPSPVTSR